jgi:hypothetical protein
MQSQEPDHAAVAELLIQELTMPKILSVPKTLPKLEANTDWMGSIESDDDDDISYETSPTKGSKYA